MIDILTDSPRAYRASNRFLMGRMLKTTRLKWRAIGPQDKPSSSQMLFVHVNLTDVPADWLSATDQYATTRNANAVSIDRRLYSTARVLADDPYDGPVIIKTRLNHRGLPELRHSFRGSLTGRLKRLGYRTIWKSEWNKMCPDYALAESIAAVPSEIWADDAFIVERFIPGNAKPPIVKFRWEFFDELSLVTRTVFDHPLCKPESFLEVTQLDDAPEDLKALRKRLHLEYGAIDYFMTDDGPVPIDCNKTTTADDDWIEAYPFIAKYIADGGALLSDLAMGRG